MFKGAIEVPIREFLYCKVFKLGQLVWKTEGSLGGGYHAKAGYYGAAGFQTGFEGSFFRGAMKIGWPIFEVKQQALSTKFTLLGLDSLSYTATPAGYPPFP